MEKCENLGQIWKCMGVLDSNVGIKYFLLMYDAINSAFSFFELLYIRKEPLCF